MSRISHPDEALPAPRRYLGHPFLLATDLTYIGTHFGYDVYVAQDLGNLYCVYGELEHQYCSAVGYELTRTNRPETDSPQHALAAACALLRHPEFILKVLEAHS